VKTGRDVRGGNRFHQRGVVTDRVHAEGFAHVGIEIDAPVGCQRPALAASIQSYMRYASITAGGNASEVEARDKRVRTNKRTPLAWCPSASTSLAPPAMHGVRP
jgi:hypothetical protein